VIVLKIKPGYEVKVVSDRYLVIPSKGSTLNFSGVITLNNSGKLLFEALQSEQTINSLKKVLTDEYEVSDEQALKDVLAFIDKLKKHNLLV